MLSRNNRNLISRILNRISGLACAYLHGSAITECFRPQSDIDLALLFRPGTGLPLETIIRTCRGRIESGTGHPPHFAVLSSKNVVFAREVVIKGQLLLSRDTYTCQRFTMHTLSMYAALNEERKKIIEQYVA